MSWYSKVPAFERVSEHVYPPVALQPQAARFGLPDRLFGGGAVFGRPSRPAVTLRDMVSTS
ncbi:hypothetical protein GCM10023084_58630 [Streptomyces lacrimifluminis]|uniref:Uncharacterized protein n=1 Tax=Streptomyces lacrimifluminis TaxID=1500077 RepID=A0A917P2B2_9ACTN|nr:hypothetical protein GCM10012282_60970 [Streptomyces lacrimifluminis]